MLVRLLGLVTVASGASRRAVDRTGAVGAGEPAPDRRGRIAAVERRLDEVAVAARRLSEPQRRLIGWLALDVDVAVADARAAGPGADELRSLARAEDRLADLVELTGPLARPRRGSGEPQSFDRLFAEGVTTSP